MKFIFSNNSSKDIYTDIQIYTYENHIYDKPSFVP